MADRFRGPRMPKHWHFMNGASLGLSADSTVLGSAGLVGGGTPFTVIRMLGGYIIGPTSAPAALDDVTIGVGIGVVSADALAAGAGSVPDPIEEPDFPWLYWRSHDFFFAGTDPESANVSASLRVDFDIKSMRKIKPREALIVVVQYANTVGNPPLHVGVQQTRVLVAE